MKRFLASLIVLVSLTSLASANSFLPRFPGHHGGRNNGHHNGYRRAFFAPRQSYFSGYVNQQSYVNQGSCQPPVALSYSCYGGNAGYQQQSYSMPYVQDQPCVSADTYAAPPCDTASYSAPPPCATASYSAGYAATPCASSYGAGFAATPCAMGYSAGYTNRLFRSRFYSAGYNQRLGFAGYGLGGFNRFGLGGFPGGYGLGGFGRVGPGLGGFRGGFARPFAGGFRGAFTGAFGGYRGGARGLPGRRGY